MDPTFVIAGRLQRDYLLPAPCAPCENRDYIAGTGTTTQARPMIDQPGGNLLYAAVGLGVWSRAPSPVSRPGTGTTTQEPGLPRGNRDYPVPSGNRDYLVPCGNRDYLVGMLTRVGEDYPREWLDSFEKRGWDTRGIHILAEALDLRYFQATLPRAPSPVSRPGTGTTTREPGLPRGDRDYSAPSGNRDYPAPSGNRDYPAGTGTTMPRAGTGTTSPRAGTGTTSPRAGTGTTSPRAGTGTTSEDQMVQRPVRESGLSRNNPVAHFARLGLPFPKSLLGYQPPAPVPRLPSGNRDYPAGTGTTPPRAGTGTTPPASPRPNDIPPDYLNAQAVHICPLDYLTVSRLTSTFRQASVTSLTLDPSAAFMTGKALEDVRMLLQGLTAFLPSEEELRALFWGRTDDLWQMAEALGEFGCEFIVVKRGARGQMLYDSVSKKRWEIPAYPARLTDATGAGDSFCGGFLAGYHKTYDPLRGVLYGCVSASLTIEGSSAFHALEALPGLAERRLESLAGSVRQI